ncbi:MAG: metal ABC transporter substrate-binding protein, partial [Planctomycetota bacterium]
GVDPHFVEVTPAQLEGIRRADLFLENGMQLEAWVPKVLEACQRADLQQGAKAHAFVTTGIVPVEIPTHEELHSDAHVHAAGNPHVWLDPLNLKIVASNVADALSRVAPEQRDLFQRRRVRFEERIDSAFFGEDLRALLGGRTLDRLHRSGRLIDFLGKRKVKGEALIAKLGGWLGRARALDRKEVVSYHRTWSYLEGSLGLRVIATLEEKPGIPPGPAYLEALSTESRSSGVQIVIAPPYYPSVRIRGFAERIEATALILPTQPGEVEGADDVFAMFDRILSELEEAQGGQ